LKVESSVKEIPNSIENAKIESLSQIAEELPKPETKNVQIGTGNVSSLSLASIRAKKELLEAQKGLVKEEIHLPTEGFTETEMLEQWYKYADRLGDKGHKIMESLLRMNEPKLSNFTIVYELPNEGSKLDFDKEKTELLGYLRGHLHNHEITIEVKVNENVKIKNAFTAQEKYNRLNEINPNLELLRKMFDLDI
jgi:hypothetical protein